MLLTSALLPEGSLMLEVVSIVRPSMRSMHSLVH